MQAEAVDEIEAIGAIDFLDELDILDVLDFLEILCTDLCDLCMDPPRADTEIGPYTVRMASLNSQLSSLNFHLSQLQRYDKASEKCEACFSILPSRQYFM
jgi:hypothetical protein